MLFKISCLCFISSAICHLSDIVTTPTNKVDQYCAMAETCFHDVIPICGKMGETATRSFLDTCDLLEYGCDTNDIYVHVDDIEGCPSPKPPVEPLELS